MSQYDRSIVMEQLLLISNLCHVECHLGEIIERTDDPKIKNHIMDKIIHVRNLRTKEMLAIGLNIEIIWCFVKHAMISYTHAVELAEKTGNAAYYDCSTAIMLIVDELISDKDINEGTVRHCPRCSEKVPEVPK
jgi:hypothetical protein